MRGSPRQSAPAAGQLYVRSLALYAASAKAKESSQSCRTSDAACDGARARSSSNLSPPFLLPPTKFSAERKV